MVCRLGLTFSMFLGGSALVDFTERFRVASTAVVWGSIPEHLSNVSSSVPNSTGRRSVHFWCAKRHKSIASVKFLGIQLWNGYQCSTRFTREDCQGPTVPKFIVNYERPLTKLGISNITSRLILSRRIRGSLLCRRHYRSDAVVH